MNQAEDSEVQMKFTTTFDLHAAPRGTRAHTVNDSLIILGEHHYYAGTVFYTDSNSLRIVLHCNERDGLVKFVGILECDGYPLTSSINTMNKKMKATVEYPRPSKKILDEWRKTEGIPSEEMDTNKGYLSSGSGDSSSLDDAATLQYKTLLKKSRKPRAVLRRCCRELETSIRDICKSLHYEEWKTESIFNSMKWSPIESPADYSDELEKAFEELQAISND